MTMGPDGCLYIVDWYNKIISHNEVARNHPDRDKASGRIWRVKPKGFQPRPVPNYSKLSSEELLARLGSPAAGDAHLAWQTLADRPQEEKTTKMLLAAVQDQNAPAARRIQALWTLGWQKQFPLDTLDALLKSSNRNLRREAVNLLRESGEVSKFMPLLRSLSADEDPEVRAAAIKTLGETLPAQQASIAPLLEFAKPSLDGPLAPGRSAGKMVKDREAYDRDFERYLVRMYLEKCSDAVAAFLASADAASLPLENRIFAALAMDPKIGAPLVASLVSQLQRAASTEELLTLAKAAQDPACFKTLQYLLGRPESRAATVEQLLAFRTQLDPAQILRVVESPAKALLQGSALEQSLGAQLVGGFQILSLESDLAALTSQTKDSAQLLGFLQALQQLRCTRTNVLLPLIKSLAHGNDAALADQALATLVSSRAPEAASHALELATSLPPRQRRILLDGLSSSKLGAKSLLSALSKQSIAASEIDGPTAEKLALVLGEGPDLDQLASLLGGVFKPVLRLNGENDAFTESQIQLKGPFTVEAWIRLDPGIDNNDSLLGANNQLDLNFAGAKFRAYAPIVVGSSADSDPGKSTTPAPLQLQDAVIASKPVTPELWTHLALTRDTAGILRVYQNGELDGTSKVAVTRDFENLKVGFSSAGKGTKGSISEFRVWNTARSATEIRANFTRTFTGETLPAGLSFYNEGGASNWNKLGAGAKITRTTDVPPLLTSAQFQALEDKTKRLMALGHGGGNPASGKTLAALCMACHTIQGQGGLIGPNLSGAGAMGLEAVIRNIVDPNAAMEAAYRIFRVELKGGEIVEAFFVSEDSSAVVVRQPGGADRRIAKAEILSSRYLRRSLMPEGLLDGFNDQQTADLLAFLMTLK
jgi:putative heme-binding domain-containing protein